MQSGDAPSILIIEDDADTRDNLRDILELDGFRIDEAATVAQRAGSARLVDVCRPFCWIASSPTGRRLISCRI